MNKIKTKDAAADFLAHRRIAVMGVTRESGNHGANFVYQRLRERGFEVFAVNPNADIVEGDQCYHDLRSIPGGVEAVVVGTGPSNTEAAVRECAEVGVKQVWMHRLFGPGSVSKQATAYGREHGMTVIDGGCPLMFGETSDPGHRMMCRVATLAGQVPRRVG